MTTVNKTIKVIIADDSKSFSLAIMELLSTTSKFNVIDVVENGQELVESKALPNADLIITDIQMPVMNGIEAAKQINHMYSKLPMIAITMHTDQLYLSDIIGVGFRGFVYKPSINEDLFEVIDNVMNNKFHFPLDIKVLRNKYS